MAASLCTICMCVVKADEVNGHLDTAEHRHMLRSSFVFHCAKCGRPTRRSCGGEGCVSIVPLRCTKCETVLDSISRSLGTGNPVVCTSCALERTCACGDTFRLTYTHGRRTRCDACLDAERERLVSSIERRRERRERLIEMDHAELVRYATSLEDTIDACDDCSYGL